MNVSRYVIHLQQKVFTKLNRAVTIKSKVT